MKKRIISLLLALVLAATLLPVQVWGAAVVDSGYCGGEGDGTNLTWSLDSDGLLTISGEGKMTDFSGFRKVAWYSYYNSISAVHISEGVTSISSYAFENCSKLTDIVIPESVNTIGEEAFAYCVNLASITLPSTMYSFGQYTFQGCDSLSEITVPTGITTLPEYVFAGSGVEKVLLPDTLEKIESGAFSNCLSLIDIVIPEGVTVLDSYAFYHATSLVSVTLPSTLPSIGERAFEYCLSLASIVIPRGVTRLEHSAFAQCDSLKEIVLSDTLTYIGVFAFSGAPISSLTIPASVKTLDRYALAGCTLPELTIPGTVEYVGELVCYGCKSLKKVTIQDGVKAIDNGAFSWCSLLTEVTIPASVTSHGQEVFTGCRNLNTVNYTGSKDQWLSDNWDSCFTSNPTVYFKGSRSVYRAVTTDLALTVYENTSASESRNLNYTLSKGATVSYNSIDSATDKNGQVSIEYFGDAVSVSKSGYVSRTISEKALNASPTIWLQKESEYPVISAVWLDETYDIMNEGYYLPIKQSTPHTVQAEVDWGNSSMQSLKLTQGTATVDISKTNNPMVKLSDYFDVSRSILVVATNADGKTSSKVLKIGSGNESTNRISGFSFNCGDGLGFTLPDSIPIIGGSKMKLGVYSPISIQVATEGSKIYVAVGAQVDGDNSTGGVKKYVDAAKVLKDTVSAPGDSISKYKEIRSAMKAFDGKIAKLKGSWGFDCGFSFIGFYEGYFDNDNNIHWLDNGLVISINGSVGYSQPFVIGPVPCYAEVEFSADAQAKLNLAISEAAKSITPDGEISAAASLDLGVGVGLKSVATLGGGVIGRASMEMTYANQNVSSAQTKLGLDGYFKVTALFFEKKWPITLAEKIVYEYPDYTSHAAYTMEGDEADDFYDTVYDTGSYSQPDLSYLASGSPFLANSGGIMPQAARAVTVDSVSAFQSNTYQNAAPQLLCLSDGTMMAVWTGYDSSRSGMNALCLYYSRYDGSSWSEPAILDNDGTMDCGFALREINGAPCVVWENAASAIETSDDLDAVAAKMSISAARYVDGAFVVERVSDAAGADMMPDVCAVGDGLSVVWVRNENGDLFANNGTNKIMCRTLTGDGWGEESVLYAGLNSVDSLAVGASGDTLQVAYSMDTDGDLTTSADMEVYINGSAATSDSVIDSGVQYENGQFYWYKDGALMSGGSEMVPAASNLRSDRYQVVEGSGVKAVLFTQANGVYSSLYGIFCDTATGTWGEPVALTDGSDSIQSFSASPTANGMQVMVNRLAVTGDGSTGDPYGEARMEILDLTLGCDLAMEDVYCDMQYYMADNRLPMTVTVANKGRQAVNQVKFTFLAEDGTELGTETLDVSLPAGVTQEIETGFTVGEVVQGRKISVQVTPVDNTDLDTSDNGAELTLQQQDIALENMFWGLNSDGQAVIYADVVNRGYTASGTLTVSLRKGSETGETIGSVTVDSLDTLGLQRVSFETAYEEGAVYYLTLDECEDDSVANNSDFVVLRQEQHDLVEGEIALSAENFPDDNFRDYLRETFDTDGDGIINNADVIEIDCSGRGIQSLKGIELFTELEKLNCADNQLTELGTSKNTKLTELDCSGNSGLKQITLPSQDVLVDTTGNGGTEVGVSGMTETGVTVSGKLNTGTLESGDRVCLTLKQGDTTCRSLRTGDDSFSFAGMAPGTYTLLASQEGYVPREYTVEIGEDGTVSDLTVQIVRRGDANGAVSSMGYAVDASDMQCLYEMLTSETYSGNIEDEVYRKAVADVNSDGAVDVYDLQRLYEAVSGINTF